MWQQTNCKKSTIFFWMLFKTVLAVLTKYIKFAFRCCAVFYKQGEHDIDVTYKIWIRLWNMNLYSLLNISASDTTMLYMIVAILRFVIGVLIPLYIGDIYYVFLSRRVPTNIIMYVKLSYNLTYFLRRSFL